MIRKRINGQIASEAILINMAISAAFDQEASKEFGKRTTELIDG